MNIQATLGLTLGPRIGALEGRNSEVFEAHDPQLNAQVVVKVVPKSTLTDPAEYYAEAKKVYDARHPNVVDVRYACETTDKIFLVMPYYSGGSLHAICRASTLTNRRVIRFGLDLLQGLHHVHSKKLIHFDVKPSNVLLDATGKAALADFGLSKYMTPAGLAQTDKLYLLHWPPEYLLSQELSSAADIYQAGLTLYRMLVGINSLEEQASAIGMTLIEQAIENGTFPDRKAFPLHVPQNLSGVVKRALQVDPDKRYPTILDMIADLAAVDAWLDWAYTASPSTSTRAWERTQGEQWRKIELLEAAGLWNVTTKSTNAATGREVKHAEFCGTGMKWGVAKTMVIAAFNKFGA